MRGSVREQRPKDLAGFYLYTHARYTLEARTKGRSLPASGIRARQCLSALMSLLRAKKARLESQSPDWTGLKCSSAVF